MRKVLLLITTILLIMALAVSAQCQSSDSLKSLVKEAGFAYLEGDDGSLNVIIEHENEISIVTLVQVEVVPGDPSGNVAYMFTTVLDAPDGFKHPNAMLKKIAELNNELTIGKVGIDEAGDVYYNSSFWLSDASAETVGLEISVAVLTSRSVKKDLAPFVEE